MEVNNTTYIFYNIFYIINQPYIIIIISCILKPMRVLSYIFVYILPSYLYFVYFFHSIYIYFYLYSSLFIMYFYMLCYVYIISYTFLFFLTHVPGRLAIMLRVYCVKIVSASVHTSRRTCVHMSISTVRAHSTRLQLLSFPLYVYTCDLCIVVLCVRRHASLQITLYIIRLPLDVTLSSCFPSSLT